MFDDWVRQDLETLPTGSALGAVLDDINIDACSGADRIRVLRAHRRQQAHYAARSLHAMTTVVEVMADDPDEVGFAEEAAAAEVAAALRLTRRAADTEMALALELRRRLPMVWFALCDGSIDLYRARVLVDATMHLSLAMAQEVASVVLPDAPLLTTGQLRAKLRKLCMDADPEDARIRYHHAVGRRRMVVEEDHSGTASLYLFNIPPQRAAAAKQRINRLALRAKQQGDKRSIDQIRADIAMDLLEGRGEVTRASRGAVIINVDLPTLLGLAANSGDVAGWGPVIADIARQVTHHQINTQWRWNLVDPDSGLPIDGGVVRRRPTAAQQRHIQTLNPTCVHPGCRMSAVDCDLDHTTPWIETQITDSDDMAPLCRHHHRIKDQHHWSYRRLPDGDYQWTSQLGHTYTTSGRDP
jgi:hypothetical protein